MADGKQDDLLDMIFSAPINLPTVTGPDPNRNPLEHETSSVSASSAAEINGNADRSRQSTISSVGKRKSSTLSGSDDERNEQPELHHEEESDTEKDDSTIHDEHDETTDFLRYNGQLGENDRAAMEDQEEHSDDEKGSELSDADQMHHEEFPELKFDQRSEQSEESEHSDREEHEEGGQDEEEEEEDDEEEAASKADKIAPLRTPEHDMLIGEMRMRQQHADNLDDDDEPNEQPDEDASDDEEKVASGSQVQYHFDSASEKESKKEEIHADEEDHGMDTAEAFLEYDRTKAVTVESVDEPSFGIDVESESDSDHESELAKFDEEAGLTSAAAMMDLLAKSEEPIGDEEPKSRTLTQSSRGSQGMRFNELSMEQHSEDKWDHKSSDFYNSNVIMKKSEAFVEPVSKPEQVRTMGRESFEVPTPVMVDLPQRQISVKRDSIVSTQTGTFEPNASVAEELCSAPGVRNLKSLFEKADSPEKPRLQGGHPPVIQYEYEPDYREHEERKVGTGSVPASAVHVEHQPQAVIVHQEPPHAEEKSAAPIVVERALEEEQKPVNELLSMFGGRKHPIPKKQPEPVVKAESTRFPQRAEVGRPVNVVPAVRSRASSTASTTQKADRPAKLSSPVEDHGELSPTRHVYKPPMFGSDEKFQSVRVVKNVRQFVRLWGQSAYVPGGPHPMSPVPVDMPDAHEMRMVKEMEEHSVYKPTPKNRSSTVASMATAFSNGKSAPMPEQHTESLTTSAAPPAPMIAANTTPQNVHHIVSEKDPLNEVMIDEVPVSERRQMFEQNVSSSDQSSGRRRSSDVRRTSQSGVRRVAQVKAVVRENEPVEVEDPKLNKIDEHVSRDEIEKGTEEIADYISQLTPVSQRRKCFERNLDQGKGNLPMPSKRTEG